MDPAALGLAAVAAGVSLVSVEGDWNVVGSMLGLVLLVVVVAHHRLSPDEGRWRQTLMKAAFAGVSALTICLVIGWPVQRLIVENLKMQDWTALKWIAKWSIGAKEFTSADATTLLMCVAWAILWFVIIKAEPRLMRLLDDRPAEQPPRR